MKLKFGIKDLKYAPPVAVKPKKKVANATVIAIAATIGTIISVSCCTAFFCMFKASLGKKKRRTLSMKM